MEPSLVPRFIVSEDVASTSERLFPELKPRTLCLAGATTPREFYAKLALADYDWENVDVFFGDERCLPPEHPDSNFRTAQISLLAKVKARVHRIQGEPCDPEAYERELRAFFREATPRFDLVVLGLGEDGHTASLVPGGPALDINGRNVALVTSSEHRSITLTLPVLSAAKVALFLVQGAAKASALSQLLEDGDIRAARVKAEPVFVIADPAAASIVRRS